jgi:protein-tyrosine phosphatase
MTTNVLFICTGNINRSASAHIILEFHSSSHKVQSCGTGKVAPLSRKVPRKMRLALEELGYDPSNHRSQGITKELLQWADEIVVMGNAHWKFLEEKHPQYLNKVSNWNVKDPHFATGNEVHRQVARQIQHLVQLNFCNRSDSF